MLPGSSALPRSGSGTMAEIEVEQTAAPIGTGTDQVDIVSLVAKAITLLQLMLESKLRIQSGRLAKRTQGGSIVSVQNKGRGIRYSASSLASSHRVGF